MAIFITFISSSHARTFEVGGKDGWTLNPSENYNNWSGRLRFLINDTLHFKYNGGSDSVLVVNKGDYDICNLNSPIMKMEGGDSLFKFDRSGPFYFISGNKSNCDQNQKLIVVVLALRNRSPPPAAATPPSPSSLPPAPAVSPVVPPSPSSPSPAAISPGSPSPAAVSPGSPSPAAVSPGSPPPAAVSPGSPTSTPSGTPVLNPPATSPGGGSSSSPGGATGESPGSNNPADVNSPPPPSPSASPVALSGTVAASLATMIFALWSIN
ncbi:early nodulin-like protein 2 isoform X2 [Cynara cardunculus var. scolymus]|nr:early nodulin-like protein 2 isoform X2 [Cynara cardunculus var. scolymus]